MKFTFKKQDNYKFSLGNFLFHNFVIRIIEIKDKKCINHIAFSRKNIFLSSIQNTKSINIITA